MNRTIALCAALALSTPALAQWPAGVPLEDQGSRPSPMGTPTPATKVETHYNEKGQLVTEDGLVVEGLPEPDEPGDASPAKDSGTGGPRDESTDPGTVE